MANFCSNCGRPLPENGVCPYCSQPVQNTVPNAQPAPAPTYVKPNAFAESIKNLPKLVAAYFKDPVGASIGEAEKGSMVSGFVMLGAFTIINFIAVLLFIVRYHVYSIASSAFALVVVGLFAPAIAVALTFGVICLVLLMGKRQIDVKGMIAVLGVNLILPAAALVLSLLFSLISYPVFQFFAVVQFVIWVVVAMVILFRVYDLKVTILNLLVILGGTVISYYIISALRNWLVNSLFSYGILDVLGSISSLF